MSLEDLLRSEDTEDYSLDTETPPHLLGRDDGYREGSYQRFYMDRVQTNPSVIFDILRHADFDPQNAGAVTDCFQLGLEEYNSPVRNRYGLMEVLEEVAEAIQVNYLEGSTPEDIPAISKRALRDMQKGVWTKALSAFELEFYGLKREIFRIRREMQLEREAGIQIKDYTLAKSMQADGKSVNQVLHLLPIYWQYGISFCLESLSHSPVERNHLERLMDRTGYSLYGNNNNSEGNKKKGGSLFRGGNGAESSSDRY